MVPDRRRWRQRAPGCRVTHCFRGEATRLTAQRELLDKYCITCHNYTDYAGGLEFELSIRHPQDDAQVTEKMLKKLRVGMMPPAGKDRPDPAAVQDLIHSLETTIDAHEKASLSVPKLHRLNRAEYANAVRDLLALDIDTSKFLPADDSSRGFDNQAGALTLSSALLDAYLSAAARISRLAIGEAASPTQVTYRIPRGHDAELSRRRPAVRHARRHPDRSHVPVRRQVHLQGVLP